MATALGAFSLGVSAADLPANFVSTDLDNPNYFFIKGARYGRYINGASFKSYAGNISTQCGFERIQTITSTATQYEPAGAVWYFESAGEPGEMTCGDDQTYYMTPVYIRNVTQPGLRFNMLGNRDRMFTEEGTIYYIYSNTQTSGSETVSGFSIMKRNTDGVLRPLNDNDGLNEYNANGGTVGPYKANDVGSMWLFEAADKNKVEGSLTNYIQAEKNSALTLIDLFDSIAGGIAKKQEIINRVNSATTSAEINDIKSELQTSMYTKIDRKVVYIVSNNRPADGKKYLYLDKTDNRFRGADHKCVLGKWQLIYSGSGNEFTLRNIATDTYISAQGGNYATSATSRRNTQYKILLYPHAVKGFTFAFNVNEQSLQIGTADSDYLQSVHVADRTHVSDMAASFSFEAANIDESEIVDGGTYVIRSKRGKRDEDSYHYDAKYPGSLITAYPADRQLARNRVNYPHGAHLEAYAPGSVWTFKKTDNGGYKIYSLIGAQTSEADNKGLVYDEATGRIEVAAGASEFFLREITDDTDDYLINNIYAICTAKEGGKYLRVSETNENGDYFIYAVDEAPANNPNDPASFFIEGIGTIHDGANPEEEYKTYARELHMFKAIAPVFNSDDLDFILAEKEGVDHTAINSVAAANEFMAMGDMTASSRAFLRLHGKMIRLKNRMAIGNSRRWLYSNTSGANSPAALTAASNAENSVWIVELPQGDDEGVSAARMRHASLRNLATGLYLQENLTTGENAAELTLRRRSSLDGKEFFAAITKGYERNMALMMVDNGADVPVYSDNATWGANTSFYAHWAVESAEAAVMPLVTISKTSTDNYVLTATAPSGTTSFAVSSAEWIGKPAIVEIPAQNEPAAYAVTEPVEVDFTNADGAATATLSGLGLAHKTEPRRYAVNFPAGFFAVDGRFTPAMTADVTVEPDPSTGIAEIGENVQAPENVYDLQGRRVLKPAKGLYIVNGVKTLVK